jgi:transcription initiation factor TFIIF subunit beta
MKGEDVAGPSGVGSEDVKMEGMDEVDGEEDDDDDDDDDMEEVS